MLPMLYFQHISRNQRQMEYGIADSTILDAQSQSMNPVLTVNRNIP